MIGTMEIHPCGGSWMNCNGICSKCSALKQMTFTTSTENLPTWDIKDVEDDGMIKYITKAQMNEMKEAMRLGCINTANDLLYEYAGIEAREYTAYNYYDEFGNFLANSDETDISDLLEKAGVEVLDNG